MYPSGRCPHPPRFGSLGIYQARTPKRLALNLLLQPLVVSCQASTNFGQSKLQLNEAEAEVQEVLRKPGRARQPRGTVQREAEAADHPQLGQGPSSNRHAAGESAESAEGEFAAGQKRHVRPRRFLRVPSRARVVTGSRSAQRGRDANAKSVESPAWRLKRTSRSRRAVNAVLQAKYAIGYVSDCLKQPERRTYRAAGVLPYMFGEDNELQVLLIKQEGSPSSLRSVNRRHGAWNLLGGKRDPGDQSAEATALREMTEETGGLLGSDDVSDGFKTVVWHPLGRYAAFLYHVKGKANLPKQYASWRQQGGACDGGRNTIKMRWISLSDLNEPYRRKMHVFLRSLLGRTAVMAWLHVRQLQHDAACGKVSADAVAEAEDGLLAAGRHRAPLRPPHMDVPPVLRDEATCDWEEVFALPGIAEHDLIGVLEGRAAGLVSLGGLQAPGSDVTRRDAGVQADTGRMEDAEHEMLSREEGGAAPAVLDDGPANSSSSNSRDRGAAAESDMEVQSQSTSADNGTDAATSHLPHGSATSDTGTSSAENGTAAQPMQQSVQETGSGHSAQAIAEPATDAVRKPARMSRVGILGLTFTVVLMSAAQLEHQHAVCVTLQTVLGGSLDDASLLAEQLFGLPSGGLRLPKEVKSTPEATSSSWYFWPAATTAKQGREAVDPATQRYLREGKALWLQLRRDLVQECREDKVRVRTDPRLTVAARLLPTDN